MTNSTASTALSADEGRRLIAVIPARAGSTRLPLKPLVDIADEPLVWRVYRRVRAAGVAARVVVATDDDRIAAAVRDRGGEVMRVDTRCDSGTQRVAHAAEALDDADWVLNVQGDLPFVSAPALCAVADALRQGASIATLACPLPPERRNDPAAVKVVRDAGGDALYFSRHPIPGALHLGIYGFSAAALRAVAHLPRSPLARAEDLEQLTWLENGWRIAVADAPASAARSIDTPDDLAAVRAHIAAHPSRRAELT